MPNCPYCGAENSLEVDYARGEVACTECATVTEMGLLEDENMRFETDHAMGGTEDADNAAAAGDDEKVGGGGAGGRSAASINRTTKRFEDAWRRMQEKSGAPESIVAGAANYLQSYIQSLNEESRALANVDDCAMACLLLAAEEKHFPIPPHELAKYDARCNALRIDGAVSRVVETLGMQEQRRQHQAAYLVHDLCRMYLERMALNLSVYLPPVEAFSKIFHDVTHFNCKPPLAVATCIYIVLTSKMVRSQLKLPDPLLTVDQCFLQVVAASRHDSSSVKSNLKNAREKIGALLECAKRQLQGGDGAAENDNESKRAQKRPRE